MPATPHDRTRDADHSALWWPRPQTPGQDGFPHHTTVGELMTPGVPAIGPHTSPTAAATTLLRHHRELLPVVDDGRRLLGAISPGALLVSLALRALHPGHHLVAPLGSAPAQVPTVNVADSAGEAAWAAVHDDIDRFHVVDDEGRLVGTVRLSTLLGTLCRDDDAIRSEVLCIAVAQETEGEQAHLVVDCRQGSVTLKATMTWRSQADTLLERVRAVEGIAELDAALSWALDDTPAATSTQLP
ncbi:CBS domain-containing protein [Streptacidiphilus sp. PAMC 29251]